MPLQQQHQPQQHLQQHHSHQQHQPQHHLANTSSSASAGKLKCASLSNDPSWRSPQPWVTCSPSHMAAPQPSSEWVQVALV